MEEFDVSKEGGEPSQQWEGWENAPTYEKALFVGYLIMDFQKRNMLMPIMKMDILKLLMDEEVENKELHRAILSNIRGRIKGDFSLYNFSDEDCDEIIKGVLEDYVSFDEEGEALRPKFD